MPRTAPWMPTRLAQSAFELFGLHGFQSVTIDEIATHAKVTKGSFYSHYDSKHAVILAACQHYYRTYQQRVHAEIAAIHDPLERLRRVVEFSVKTCIIDQQNRLFTTEVFALALRDAEVRAGWAQFYDSVREIYLGLLLAARAAGQVTVADPRKAVDLMLSAIEGIKQRAAFEPHVSDPSEQESMVDGLMRILGVPVTEAAAVGQ